MNARHEDLIVDEVLPSPEDLLFLDCRKVLKAGIWLIRNGYGKMAILPYAAPSGCYWRCEFHPIGQPRKAFYRYSTGSGGRYLQDHCGGIVRRTISPKGLARAIMVSVPEDLKNRCAGDVTQQTESWLVQVERALSQRWIPQAFQDYTSDYSKWELVSLHGAPNSWMAPQPGYVVPGTEPTWRQEPFWRSCAAQGETLRERGPFVVDPSRIDDAVTEEIATEVFRAMQDAGEYEPQQIMAMAVKSALFRLATSNQDR